MTKKVLRIANEMEVTDYQMEELRRNARDEVHVETRGLCLLPIPMTSDEFIQWFDEIIINEGGADLVSLEFPGISDKLANELLMFSNFLVDWGGELLIPVFDDKGNLRSYSRYYCLI